MPKYQLKANRKTYSTRVAIFLIMIQELVYWAIGNQNRNSYKGDEIEDVMPHIFCMISK